MKPNLWPAVGGEVYFVCVGKQPSLWVDYSSNICIEMPLCACDVKRSGQSKVYKIKIITKTQSSMRWLESTSLYQEVPKHPSSPLRSPVEINYGINTISYCVTQVNQIESLEAANRFIILNKGSFKSTSKQGPDVLYMEGTWMPSGSKIFITSLVFQSCYVKWSPAI